MDEADLPQGGRLEGGALAARGLEDKKARVAKSYVKSRIQMQKSNFLKSCISEGLLPKGVKMKFNLAMNVNDEELVAEIENSLDLASSRLLDSLYIDSQRLERQLELEYEESVAQLRSVCLEEAVRRILLQIKQNKRTKIEKREETLKRKLIKLKNEKRAGRLPPGWSLSLIHI